MYFRLQLLWALALLYICYSLYLLCFTPLNFSSQVKGDSDLKVTLNKDFLRRVLNQSDKKGVDALANIKSIELIQNGKQLIVKKVFEKHRKGKRSQTSSFLRGSLSVKNLIKHQQQQQQQQKQQKQQQQQQHQQQQLQQQQQQQQHTVNSGSPKYTSPPQVPSAESKRVSDDFRQFPLPANIIPRPDNVDLEKNLKFNGTHMVPFSEDEMKYFGNDCKNDEENIEYLIPLLERWDAFATRENITYFLTAGALFGAFLQARPIDCDSDLDVLVDYEDVSKLAKLQTRRNFSGEEYDNVSRLVLQTDWMIENDEKRRRFNCEGKQVRSLTDSCAFQEPMARFIYNSFYVDVFSYKQKGEKITKLIRERTLEKSDVFPRKRCKMMGVDTYCPRDTQKFLQTHYNVYKVKAFRDHFEKVRLIPNAFEKLK